MPKVEPIINIENIVASAKVKQMMELNSVMKAFLSAEYRPQL
jgi:TATA-box binding protein (TBP) (component of TFIID and TFIIIB)